MQLQTVTVLQMWGANVSLDVLDAVRGEHHALLELIFRQHWSPCCVAARCSGSFNTTLWAASHKRLNVGIFWWHVCGQGQTVLPLATCARAPAQACVVHGRPKTSAACLGVHLCLTGI